MVFGVFDFLHPGHISFLRQARTRGTELIVIVARDRATKALKRRTPHHNERRRIAALRRLSFVSKVTLGDKTEGSYTILKKWKPDVICVGYDQGKLKKDLTSKMRMRSISKIPIVKMRPFAPHKFRSSLLRRMKKRRVSNM